MFHQQNELIAQLCTIGYRQLLAQLLIKPMLAVLALQCYISPGISSSWTGGLQVDAAVLGPPLDK